MADSSSDLTDVSIQFHNSNEQHDVNNPADCSVYLGEILRYEILITKPKEIAFKGWKRRVAQLSAHACVIPRESRSGNVIVDKQPNVDSEGNVECSEKEKSVPKTETVVCAVIATYIDSVEKKAHVESGSLKGTSEKHFKDGSTCIIPMSTCVWNTPGQCQRAELTVSLWLSASPQKINRDLDAKRDFQLTSVTKTVHVRDPPHLKVRFVSCGQQHLLLVQVKNASRQTITIKNLTIVPSSSPSCDHREFFKDTLPFRDSCRIRSESTAPLVSLSLSGGSVFPVILAGCEEMALIYRLDLSSVASEVELSFHSYLRWTHAETCKEINTVFRLPKLRVRYPAFTVTVKCEGPVETGKTFYLTYNIANNLQDFLSVRLYWNLDNQLALLKTKDDKDGRQERQKLECVKQAIICHDPDVFIGYYTHPVSMVKVLTLVIAVVFFSQPFSVVPASEGRLSCPRGCMQPVSVGFQILQPGLYEFGELMKLNLRWALPDSQSTLKQDSVGTPVSSDTISTLSGDDQLQASTELWRDRSGSTCSLQTPTWHSTEEHGKTFATKSYSFGDLGPTLSADSDDACRMRFKNIKRSTAVLPPRPPPPRNLSQPEKDLTNRNNFLKKSFKIYIPTGC